jgi:hypothetical protein
MNLNTNMTSRLTELVEEYRAVCRLQDWAIRVAVGPTKDPARGACSAMPEYREADVVFDVESWETGDDAEEIVSHEVVHCVTWPLMHVAEELAGEDTVRQEWVRVETERTNTDVAQIILKQVRRAKKAEERLAEVQKEVKALKKALQDKGLDKTKFPE